MSISWVSETDGGRISKSDYEMCHPRCHVPTLQLISSLLASSNLFFRSTMKSCRLSARSSVSAVPSSHAPPVYYNNILSRHCLPRGFGTSLELSSSCFYARSHVL